MLGNRTDNLIVRDGAHRDETTQQLGEQEKNHQESYRDQADHKQERADDVLHQDISNSLATGVERDERIQTRFLVIPCAERFLQANRVVLFQQP